MATEYKILGQSVGSLKYDCPQNTSTVISKIKINNDSYETPVSISVGNTDEFYIGIKPYTDGLGGQLEGSLLQSDGKLLIFGPGLAYESEYTGDWTLARELVRLNSDFSIDKEFVFAGWDFSSGDIKKLAEQVDLNKIIIATLNRIYRINSNGSMDTIDNQPYIVIENDRQISGLHTQSDGKIIVTGDFATINNISKTAIARLNQDGTIDNSFSVSLQYNSQQWSRAFITTSVLQNDGKIIISGNFTGVNNSSKNGIARLNADGTTDETFLMNSDLISDKLTAVDKQNRVLVGGSASLIRYNEDGSLDESFSANIEQIYSGGYMLSIGFFSDDKILLAGYFQKVDGVLVDSLAILNEDGSLYNKFIVDKRNPNQAAIASAVNYSDSFLVYFSGEPINSSTIIPKNNKQYIIKDKLLGFDETIDINGGIALEQNQSIFIDTGRYSNVIIQAYGMEETI